MTFTTEGLGAIPGSGSYADDVVRKKAWEAAHPGGTIGRETPDELAYTARWPGGEVAATAFGSLGALMATLGHAEEAGRCPVHRKAAR